MRQLGLFFAGAGFLAASMVVTRRAVTRKKLATFPKFYHQSHRDQPPSGKEGNPLLAVEALFLATLNTASFFMMLSGGAAWALDISSLDDLRRMARRKIASPETPGPPAAESDVAMERDIEDWAAKVLGKTSSEGDGATPPQKR